MDNTIGVTVRKNARRFGNNTIFYDKNNDKNFWKGTAWNTFNQQQQLVSKALINYGIEPQQNVGIFAQNMPEWMVADMGIMSIGAVTVPMYATSAVKEIEYIVNEAEIAILFVGDQEQYNKALEVLKNSNHLKLIVVLSNTIKLVENSHVIFLNDFLKFEQSKYLNNELEKRYSQVKSHDLASIIYTSGTTGEPKGVMLTHSNFYESLKVHDIELNVSEKDRSLSFLPLSHIFERSWVFFCLYKNISVYFNKDPKQIASVLPEVQPTVMCTVPRLFEKIYSKIEEKKNSASNTKRALFNWALKVGAIFNNEFKRNEKSVPISLKIKFAIADKLVLSKLRKIFGNHINFMPCGGAPLAPEMVAYFHAFGIPVKCGYGLTETTATVSLYGNTQFEFHSAGKTIEGSQIKIGANNEILVKGPGVMKGYFKKPAETLKVFKDGWFCTGDAGNIDDNGNLIITDRIKDLMKTSGGKYIAPQKLESALINDAFIEQIAVIGDKQKYVTALAVPCFENLKKYALKNKITFKSIEELIANNEIITFFENRFEELQQEFSVFEKIKKFTLLPKEFSLETGEITATLKLKRAVIQQKYKDLIENMYRD